MKKLHRVTLPEQVCSGQAVVTTQCPCGTRLKFNRGKQGGTSVEAPLADDSVVALLRDGFRVVDLSPKKKKKGETQQEAAEEAPA